MSSDRAELIRSAYEAWNRGDDGGITAALAEDVEWHGHPRLPEPGPFVGKEAVKSWLAGLRVAWDEISIHPLAFAEAGNDVVVLINITGRGRGSGLEVQSGIDAHVWTVAEDGRVVRMRWIQGHEAARRTGLSDREREVLRLRGAEGLSDSEIGERLGESPEQVRSIADGALEALPRLAGGGSE